MKEFLKSFGAALATSVAPGLYGSNSSASLGRMLKDGTKEDFNKYLAARQAAVKGEYDAYKTKFDAFEQQAKTLTDLIGDNTIDAETELTSQEAAARLMKGKTSADVGELITKFKALRDQDGVNIRELLGDSLKRGDEQERRNYTTADIARMQVGGGFKYTPKPFDLRERRSGLGNFLRDQGLFTKTFETEREALAKKQAEMITAGFNAKYTGDTPYQEAQGFITVDAAKLRTQDQQRATELSILNLNNAKDASRFARAQEVRSQRLFDSTMANKSCILQYISDGMENGNDSDVSVNKLFEEYIYAYIKYALLNNKFGVQEYIVNRVKKDKQALLRNAKIRLSNIHPSRLIMNIRGENKWIK